MCKATSRQVASQGVFHVVLLDASGKEQGFIGYRFGADGAMAAANSWNAQPDRELTAIIREGLPTAGDEIRQGLHTVHTPSVTSRAGWPGSAGERTVRAMAELAQDYLDETDVETYRVLVFAKSGDAWLVDRAYSREQAQNWVDTWQHDKAVALVVSDEQLGDPDNYMTLDSETREKYVPADKASGIDSNALDELNDSDVDEDDERSTGANVVYDLEKNARKIRADYVREVLQDHLEQIEASLDHVFDGGDVGIISRSLQALCEAMGCGDEYESGSVGGWSNDALVESLGFEVTQTVAG